MAAVSDILMNDFAVRPADASWQINLKQMDRKIFRNM